MTMRFFWQSSSKCILPSWKYHITGLPTRCSRLLDALAAHNRHQARTAVLIMWRTGLASRRGPRTRVARSRLLGSSGDVARPEVEEPSGSHGTDARGLGAALCELAGKQGAEGQGGCAGYADGVAAHR